MKKLFSENSLDNCIEAASKELGVPKESLKYEVVEEKRTLFWKKVTILVEIDEKENIQSEVETKTQAEENIIFEEIKNSDLELQNNKKDEPKIELNESDGTIRIEKGKIIVTNPKEGGEPASIGVKDRKVRLIVDGSEIKAQTNVYKESVIEVEFDESEAGRRLDISLSKDKMEAYAQVTYTVQDVYKLKDKEIGRIVALESEISKKIEAPRYTVEELKQELGKNYITYGIIEENLKKCVEGSDDIIVVAKGQPTINGEDDVIELKFKLEDVRKQLEEDKGGNVDFKSIGIVEAAHKGDIIAVKHPGSDGIDGSDVSGKAMKAKLGKKLRLKVGNGASIKENDTVVADIDGKPTYKSSTFYVFPIHEIRGDVDLKTGNIKFIGDVIVHGSVKEGMEIDCGNLVDVGKDVERATIRSRGDIIVNGNIIVGKVYGGGEDVDKLKTLNHLEQLKELLKNLVLAVTEIKKHKILGENKKDGEIIKILIENKFKMMSKVCFGVMATLNSQSENYGEEELVVLMKSKLLGMGPINIKKYSELDEIIECIDELISKLKENLSIPVNVKMAYCQDSIIQSSGDVVLFGKGEYISEITANGSINFTQEKSVARGGSLKAKGEIRCKTVGSTAGVSTRLEVEKEGHIYVDVAYQNTMFIVGTREFILDMPSKNIHAYLDKDGDIVVDRFKM